MAFRFTNSKGKAYFLHSKETTLKNGHKQTIYFFAKEMREGAIDAIPRGRIVSESRNGLPILRLAGNPTTPPPKPKRKKGKPKLKKLK
jgi:hypothetical protein